MTAEYSIWYRVTRTWSLNLNVPINSSIIIILVELYRSKKKANIEFTSV